MIPKVVIRYSNHVQRQNLKRTVSNCINWVLPRKLLSPIRQFTYDGHNEVLFRDLELTSNSVVLEFGGYIGEFSEEILQRFDCQLHIFEPVHIFVTELRKRFDGSGKVWIYDYAVGLEQRDFFLVLDGEATSEFRGSMGLPCSLRSVDQTIIPRLPCIDLVAINIEGGEYELVPALHQAGVLNKVGQILIQFHKVGPNSDEDVAQIRAIMRETHTLEWHYEYVWELWKIVEKAK